ncbi:MAG: hypothetical protein LBD50_03710 [Rickettsiales bacterium]|nr:hypothetical protein [Rickettsiales bacterium]
MKKLILPSIILMLGGCASIISGGSQQINVQPGSTSHGRVDAEVISKSGVQTVRLPAVVNVKRSSQDIIVHIKEEDNQCLEETQVVISSGLNGWFLGNFITGGLLGSTTDGLTGAVWSYDDITIVPVQPRKNCKK